MALVEPQARPSIFNEIGGCPIHLFFTAVAQQPVCPVEDEGIAAPMVRYAVLEFPGLRTIWSSEALATDVAPRFLGMAPKRVETVGCVALLNRLAQRTQTGSNGATPPNPLLPPRK